jgi:hypothetical protein
MIGLSFPSSYHVTARGAGYAYPLTFVPFDLSGDRH